MDRKLKITHASISDIGFRRAMNQDTCVVRICENEKTWQDYGHLAMVADGMGGHAVGEIASQIASEVMPVKFFAARAGDPKVAMKSAIEQANTSIYRQSLENPAYARMGTTCTALTLTPVGAIIGHVGDSRAYRIRKDQIDQLTFDHSLHWELIRRGRLDPGQTLLEETQHVITRCLGPHEVVEVDIEGPHLIRPGDTFLLCSDGLTAHVEDAEIGMIGRILPPETAVRLLVNLTNLRGGSDNVTVVIVQVANSRSNKSTQPVDVDTFDDIEVIRESKWKMWITPTAVSIAGLSMVATGILSFTDHIQEALGTGLLSIAVLVFLLYLSWQKHRRLVQDLAAETRTELNSPYRTASAVFNKNLFAYIVALEEELEQSASEEAWTFDEALHAESKRAYEAAVGKNELATAFGYIADALDVLMRGVQEYRQKLKDETKHRGTDLD